MSKVIVITGANRGIGFEMAKILSEKGIKIIGTARNPEGATELKGLANVIGVVKADQADVTSYAQTAADIEKLAPDGIDELWHNAGQLLNTYHLTELKPAAYVQELTVNVVGPAALTQALLPALRKKDTRRIIFITSAMGSGTYASYFINSTVQGLPTPPTFDFNTNSVYCSTKAALTHQTIGWHSALYKEKFTIIPVHPGWVKTSMGGDEAPLTPVESATAVIKTVEGRELSPEIAVYNYDGTVVPW